jgi:DNA-binding response OmpR family regulator
MKKILIAEDDKYLASAYKLKLEREGYTIQIAEDGQETLNSLDSFKPDLIILDIMMPVKDGFITLKELRANSLYQNIPVIVASNSGLKEDKEKSMSFGATDFIVKSDLSMADLLIKIKNLLSK